MSKIVGKTAKRVASPFLFPFSWLICMAGFGGTTWGMLQVDEVSSNAYAMSIASGSGAAVALAFWKLLQRMLDKDRRRLLTAWVTVVVSTGVVYSILENRGVPQIWAIACAAAAGLLLVIMWYIRITIAKRTTI